MKRLYKSRRDRIIDGVCGGIAEYLNIDPAIVRIIFVLLFFMGGVGLLLYIAGMLIIPVNPEHIEKPPAESQRRRANVLFILGLLLLIIGTGLLIENLGWPFWGFFKAAFNYLIPILLIAIGIFLIITYFTKKGNSIQAKIENETTETKMEEMPKRLFRSRKNRMIFGVCSGLGEYLNTDPTIVRILWVILGISSLGIAVLLYLIMAIIVPEEQA